MDLGLPIPIDVMIGFILIFIFGVLLGAIICIPIVQKNSKVTIPLEQLTNDIIWKYTPDWALMFAGCLIFLIMSFVLVSGVWQV